MPLSLLATPSSLKHLGAPCPPSLGGVTTATSSAHSALPGLPLPEPYHHVCLLRPSSLTDAGAASLHQRLPTWSGSAAAPPPRVGAPLCSRVVAPSATSSCHWRDSGVVQPPM